MLCVVMTWSGERTVLDQEMAKERRGGSKRRLMDSYNEEIDQGRVSHTHYGSHQLFVTEIILFSKHVIQNYSHFHCRKSSYVEKLLK